MSSKPQYKNPPASPVNQWVRDALEAANLSQKDLSDALTRELRANYDRSIVQKMTVSRRIRVEEMHAISRITNFPAFSEELKDEFIAIYRKLSKEHQETVRTMMHGLLVAQEVRNKR